MSDFVGGHETQVPWHGAIQDVLKLQTRGWFLKNRWTEERSRGYGCGQGQSGFGRWPRDGAIGVSTWAMNVGPRSSDHGVSIEWQWRRGR